jgi:hypothetical protein
MHKEFAGWIVFLLCVIGGSSRTWKPLVYGLLDSDGTIYRESAQEDFGSRTTVKAQSFEF